MKTIATIILAVTLCGCLGPKAKTERYPFPVMLDPVTEQPITPRNK